VVLFRLPWSEPVEALVRVARNAGVPLLFDIDDLAFDPSFHDLMPFKKRYSPDEWARTYGRQTTALRRTFDAADAFIGSTPELAEHATALGKKSHVHRNVVPESYLRAGRRTERVRRALRARPTIGYFSAPRRWLESSRRLPRRVFSSWVTWTWAASTRRWSAASCACRTCIGSSSPSRTRHAT